jgi:hypothetical protein
MKYETGKDTKSNNLFTTMPGYKNAGNAAEKQPLVSGDAKKNAADFDEIPLGNDVKEKEKEKKDCKIL